MKIKRSILLPLLLLSCTAHPFLEKLLLKMATMKSLTVAKNPLGKYLPKRTGIFDISVYPIKTENKITLFAHSKTKDYLELSDGRRLRIPQLPCTNKTILIRSLMEGSCKQDACINALEKLKLKNANLPYKQHDQTGAIEIPLLEQKTEIKFPPTIHREKSKITYSEYE
ncbi:hypothetical protein IPH25_01405 [bacterium]|nr:MAG: hypothetical protein IPG37_03530 [bacterium]QQR62084.1 MAG: hypothetical protein IPH25_01405 [bacterium]QQR63360.1 MAG: hypothetical protein IPH67_02720 [bacterium]